jgi:hypothetical protein
VPILGLSCVNLLGMDIVEFSHIGLPCMAILELPGLGVSSSGVSYMDLPGMVRLPGFADLGVAPRSSALLAADLGGAARVPAFLVQDHGHAARGVALPVADLEGTARGAALPVSDFGVVVCGVASRHLCCLFT